MTGLYEQIKVAKTDVQIVGLLEKSKSYHLADPDTRRKWQRAAATRLTELAKSKKTP